MICTLYRTIYEHLRYINMILNFLYIIQYIWYDTNNYKRNHDFWAQVLFTNALKVINLIVVNMWPVDCTYSLVSGDLSTYRASASVGGYSFVIQKLLHFTHFNKKYTHISECKVVHNYTNATVTVHICTVTVAFVYLCTTLHQLMWVFFWPKCVKWRSFCIIEEYPPTHVMIVTFAFGNFPLLSEQWCDSMYKLVCPRG